MTIPCCGFGLWAPLRTAAEYSPTTCSAVALWVTGDCLSSACRPLPWGAVTETDCHFYSEYQRIRSQTDVFLWTCDSVKTCVWRWRWRPADMSSVNIGFFGSSGVNHWGDFPLTESPSVKMLPSPPGVTFPHFLTTSTDKITFFLV